jgi:hypothetical protein
VRNPFGVMDVPDPNDEEVTQFAGSATLEPSADDENAKPWNAKPWNAKPWNAKPWNAKPWNAKPWSSADIGGQHDTIEGNWSSRWNGGADPTIAGDAANKWKQGQAEARITGDRVYLLFDWDSGARKGLIDARREGPATAGRQIHQFKQPGGHASLDRQNRERSKNRRALDPGTSGFPQIESSDPHTSHFGSTSPRAAAIAAAGRRRPVSNGGATQPSVFR